VYDNFGKESEGSKKGETFDDTFQFLALAKETEGERAIKEKHANVCEDAY
jgi:hypothetical protein